MTKAIRNGAMEKLSETAVAIDKVRIIKYLLLKLFLRRSRQTIDKSKKGGVRDGFQMYLFWIINWGWIAKKKKTDRIIF